MWGRRTSIGMGAIGVLAAAGLVLGATACGDDGVSKNDYTKVQQQLQDQQTQNQQLQAQLTSAQKGGQAANAGTPAAGATKAASAASTDMTLLIGAHKVPKATPPPSPTATPPGYVAPAKPTPPPSTYQSVGPFAVYVETLATTHQSDFDIAANIACSPSGVFMRGQRIVWRYEVIDTSTGMRITDKDAGATLKVVLPGGVEVPGRWGQRGGGQAPDAPWMWSSNWDIPLDYPLGAIDYHIVITTKDGRSMTWAPPALIAKNLDEDTRPKVVQ